MKFRPVEAVLFHTDRQTEGQTNWRRERQIYGWTWKIHFAQLNLKTI